MTETSPPPVDGARLLSVIREETRFEIGLLHARVNALIAAEAFLTISFTAAMAGSGSLWGKILPAVVAPTLSVTGLVLALLAWPGIDASFRIVTAWDARQARLMRDDPALVDALWRPGARRAGDGREDPDQRISMLFARAAPIVFVIAWAVLTGVALILPHL